MEVVMYLNHIFNGEYPGDCRGLDVWESGLGQYDRAQGEEV